MQATPYPLSCAQFAALNQVKPQTVRARICNHGSYFSVIPRKLANGRLAFPEMQVQQGFQDARCRWPGYFPDLFR